MFIYIYPPPNNNQSRTIPNESESWCTYKGERKELTFFWRIYYSLSSISGMSENKYFDPRVGRRQICHDKANSITPDYVQSTYKGLGRKYLCNFGTLGILVMKLNLGGSYSLHGLLTIWFENMATFSECYFLPIKWVIWIRLFTLLILALKSHPVVLFFIVF